MLSSSTSLFMTLTGTISYSSFTNLFSVYLSYTDYGVLFLDGFLDTMFGSCSYCRVCVYMTVSDMFGSCHIVVFGFT